MQDSIFNVKKKCNFKYLKKTNKPVIFKKDYRFVCEVKGIVCEVFLEGTPQFEAQETKI